jgi:PIN domain nuclease of toxin-antitoxin system
MEEPSNRKLLSIASCWEIAIKAGLGKLNLGEPSATYLAAALDKTGFELMPITLNHAVCVETLPLHHKDPFDRMLIAQALSEDLSIVSVDCAFDAYGVKRLW